MSDPTDDLIEQFAKAVYGPREDVQPRLAAEAKLALPVIRMGMDQVRTKAANAPMAFDWLMEQFDADETADKIHGLSREEIGLAVDKVLSPDGGDLAQQARGLKHSLLAMTEKDEIAFARAVDAVLPAGLQAAERAARGDLSLEQQVRDARALAQTLPDGAVAEALARQQENLSREHVIDSLYAFAQDITPDQLRRLHRYMQQNLEGAQLALFVKRSAEATQELYEAADAGNYLRPAHPAKIKAFGCTLHEILSVIEGGFADAGIVPPPVVRELLIDRLDPGKLLRAAKAIADDDAAQYGITREVAVGKPLRFKTPAPKP